MHYDFKDMPIVELQDFLDAVIGGKAKTGQFKPVFKDAVIRSNHYGNKYAYFANFDTDITINNKELERFNSVAKSNGYEFESYNTVRFIDDTTSLRYVKRKDNKKCAQ